MKDEPITYACVAMVFIVALIAVCVTLFAVVEFTHPDGSTSEGFKTLGVAAFFWATAAGFGWYLYSSLKPED